MVAFDSIPSNLRVPIFTVEFNSTRAQQGPALLAYRALLIGQKLSTGTATADSIAPIASADQAIPLAGRGSMLHRLAIAWFASNKTTPVYLGVLADNSSGTAASATIVVAGPATAGGPIFLYLGSERLVVRVAQNDASTAIATAIRDAINANPDLPVTATVSGSTVTITFRHRGLVGNSYDIRLNFLPGESLPVGVGLTITAMAGGAANPSLGNLIAAITDLWFQIWAHPYTDATSLSDIEKELLSRAGPMRMIDGVAISSVAGNMSTLTTLGTGRNSQYSSIWAQPGASPLTPPMEFAAETAALLAFNAAVDPARPFQTLAYTRAFPTAEADQWDANERNQFLFSGISTTRRADGGVVQLDRAITTYQTNAAGSADTSYLDVNTPLTLMYLRYAVRVRFQTKFPRHKLADDGTKFDPGQPVITPTIAKAELISWAREMEGLGLMQNVDQFKRDVVTERPKNDPNRLNWLATPNLIGRFIVGAGQFQFIN